MATLPLEISFSDVPDTPLSIAFSLATLIYPDGYPPFCKADCS